LTLKKLRLNPKNLFISEGLDNNLAGKSVRGGVITMGSTGVMFGINLARTMVLARLLTPEDFGIIGMVTVFITFVGMFKDAGLSMATIQKTEISKEQISTLAWFNLIITGAFGLILFAAAPAVSWFYEKPELTWITMALAISFIFSGLTIQHRALLRRYLRFDSLALVTILSTMGGVAITVVLALLGWDYWALVVGSIATTAFDALLTFFFCPWIPGKIVRGSGVRNMLKFGIHLTGFDFFNYFSRNADSILIGKFIGANELGLYNKAYQLFMLPIHNILNPINQVAMPALSSIKNNHSRYRSYYLRIVNLIATLTFPIAMLLYFEADFIINLFLGNQWKDAVPVFKILALAGLITPVASTRGLVMVSNGYSKRYFHWGIIYSLFIVTSFIIGVNFGIEGVAISYVITIYSLFFPSLIYAFKNTPIEPKLFLFELLTPFLITLFLSVGYSLIIKWTNEGNSSITLIRISAFILISIGANYARKDFRDIVKQFLLEFKKKK